MPPETRKPTAADYQAWALACLTTGVNLTDWEKQFVTDIYGTLDLRGRISEKQADLLEKIYARTTP